MLTFVFYFFVHVSAESEVVAALARSEARGAEELAVQQAAITLPGHQALTPRRACLLRHLRALLKVSFCGRVLRSGLSRDPNP